MSDRAVPDFEIGLALAGAISAGAYTAGVIDYLFQALEEWEKARTPDHGKVPAHRAGLQVVAGASAGAITGALGAVALARGMRPMDFDPAEIKNSHRSPNASYQSVRCVLPALYDTWVTHPRMVAPDGKIDFLSQEDLAAGDAGTGQTVVSVLNAQLLEWIKTQALLPTAAVRTPPYEYVAEKLHVYMTVSNLRGIPFTVEFVGGKYGMQTHGDRVHYVVSGVGSWSTAQTSWVTDDKSMPLGVNELPRTETELKSSASAWNDYGEAALASSAFPIGLAPRRLTIDWDQYNNRSYPFQLSPNTSVNPSFPADPSSSKTFSFLNVDGGVINNNPFEFAQYALMGNPDAVASSGASSTKAVVMVAPFPEPPAFLPEGQPAPELVRVIRALFPALINQARFKVTELVPAFDPNHHGRFLIAPHRKLPSERGQPERPEERYTIACGLLGGFGGFLDEQFRAHDFQLGRRNCQAFLRGTFALPAGNPIADAIRNLPEPDRFRIAADPETKQPEKYPIIPLLGSAAPEVPLPCWPQMSQGDFEELIKRVKGRLQAVAPRLVRDQTSSRVLRFIAYAGLAFGKGKVVEYVRYAVLSDLIRRDQIQGWKLPTELMKWLDAETAKSNGWEKYTTDDVRAVAAELASPGFDFRTVGGISRKTHLRPDFVQAVLDQLERLGKGGPFAISRQREQGRQLYTLASRLDSKGLGERLWNTWWSLPGVRSVGDWLQAPSID